MRRYTFYLLVALLAFGIGLFVVFRFYWKTVQQPLIAEKTETVESTYDIEAGGEQIKYGCKEKELVQFWEKLDKEAFLKFKGREIKIRNTDAAFTSYPNSPDGLKSFEKEWNDFQREFNCAYFSGIDDDIGFIDLNNDGEKEIFVIGEFSGYHAEKELLVFQKKNDIWKLILFDIGNQETEIKGNKTNGYFDIETSTSITGGSKYIDTFGFDGKNYEERNCLSESTVIKKDNEIVVVDKPVITRIECYQKFSNVLKISNL